MMDYIRRQTELASALSAISVDAVLINDLVDIRYLCGFVGTTAELIFTPKQSWLITDPRYADADDMTTGTQTIITDSAAVDTIVDIVSGLQIKQLGFDSHRSSYFRYQTLQKKLENIELVPVFDLVAGLREQKEVAEIEMIKKAVTITEQALEQTLCELHTGVSEREIAAVFEFNASHLGSEHAAFPTIVAFGLHAATPHALTGDRQLRPGDAIKIDCGASFGGYCADITRTFFWLSVPAQLQSAYNTVLAANHRAVESIAPGVALKIVDEAARALIDDTEFAGLFTHGIGHGLGLDVHERPNVNKLSTDIAKTGMVFTIEPGIYISGIGGVRIEDIVAINADGAEILTSFPNKLAILTGDKEG